MAIYTKFLTENDLEYKLTTQIYTLLYRSETKSLGIYFNIKAGEIEFYVTNGDNELSTENIEDAVDFYNK